MGHEGKMNKVYEDKWVANHSSRVLSEKEKEVLSKGLNFAPPMRIPVPEIIIAVEEGLSKINSSDAKLSRNSIIGVLNKAIVPRSNITPEEIKAMKDLQKDDSIIILPADKGKATVILDKVDYDRKTTTTLSDIKTYKKF